MLTATSCKQPWLREGINNKLNPHVTSTLTNTPPVHWTFLLCNRHHRQIYLFIFPQEDNESQVLLGRQPCGLTLISISPKISNHQLVVVSLSLFFSDGKKDVNKPEEHLLQWWLHCESLDLLYQQISLAYKTKSNALFGTWTWTTWLCPFVVCHCN